MNKCFELLPYFEMTNIQGNQPFSSVQKKELIEESLAIAQKISNQKSLFYNSLRSFDIKYPAGVNKLNEQTFSRFIKSLGK